MDSFTSELNVSVSLPKSYRLPNVPANVQNINMDYLSLVCSFSMRIFQTVAWFSIVLESNANLNLEEYLSLCQLLASRMIIILTSCYSSKTLLGSRQFLFCLPQKTLASPYLLSVFFPTSNPDFLSLIILLAIQNCSATWILQPS